jgi:hypothetical protein
MLLSTLGTESDSVTAMPSSAISTIEQTASGKVKIVGKDGLRSRLRRSPDKADALAYACWKHRGASVGGQVVTL